MVQSGLTVPEKIKLRAGLKEDERQSAMNGEESLAGRLARRLL